MPNVEKMDTLGVNGNYFQIYILPSDCGAILSVDEDIFFISFSYNSRIQYILETPLLLDHH